MLGMDANGLFQRLMQLRGQQGNLGNQQNNNPNVMGSAPTIPDTSQMNPMMLGAPNPNMMGQILQRIGRLRTNPGINNPTMNTGNGPNMMFRPRPMGY